VPTLYRLQEQDARTIAGRRGISLFYEPGAGKTATAIRAAQLAAGPDFYQWGIVAPRNALKGEDSWEEALKVWAPTKSNIFLTHWEALDKPAVRDRLAQSRFLFLDEAHRSANVQTKISASTYYVSSRVLAGGGWSLPMTGTPIFNGVAELGALLVYSGAMPADSYNNFVWRYSRPAAGTFNFTEALRIPELRQVLNAYTIRRTVPEMGIQLPPLYPIKWPINLARENAGAEYNAAAADFGKWYLETQGKVLPPLARFSTLRRLLSLAKAPTVAEIARQQILIQKNVLIFTEYRDSAELIHKKLKGSSLVWGGDSDGARVQAFASTRTGARGLAMVATGGALSDSANLQAFDSVYILDMPWTPADLDQWFKRVYRNRQTQPVTLVFFTAVDDAAEAHVERVLLRKTDLLIKLGLAPTGNLRQIGF
jgi:hypothetical protein